MTIILEPGYVLPGSDRPLTHARIAHANNWLSGGVTDVDDSSALLLQSNDHLLLENNDTILLESRNNAASGYFADGPLNSLTYEKWRPSALPATWEYDHGGAGAADYCCIGAHTLGSNANTLQVQYWSGAAWVDLIAATAITSDAPIMAIFAPQTRQRWRVRVTGGTPPEIGVVRFGQALQMQRALYGGHAPVMFARRTVLRSNRSDTGEFLGRSKQRSYLNTSHALQHLTAAWMRAHWESFQTAIEEEPFFIVWRPGSFGDVALAQADDLPIPENMGVRDLMRVTLNIRARGYD